MRYDQWWECKFIAEGIIDQGEALREDPKDPSCCPIKVVEAFHKLMMMGDLFITPLWELGS